MMRLADPLGYELSVSRISKIQFTFPLASNSKRQMPSDRQRDEAQTASCCVRVWRTRYVLKYDLNRRHDSNK
jgi:hypothetical protein